VESHDFSDEWAAERETPTFFTSAASLRWPPPRGTAQAELEAVTIIGMVGLPGGYL